MGVIDLTTFSSLLNNPAVFPHPATDFNGPNSTYQPIGNSTTTQTQPSTVKPSLQVTTPSSASISQPTPPTVVNNQQTPAITVNELLEVGGGLPNSLNKFFQVQPVFTLFMTAPIDPISTNSVSGGQAIPGILPYGILDSMQKVILAQTGVTGYNIKSVEFDSLVGPNPTTKSTSLTRVNIEISEQMGVGFLDSIAEAAQVLNVPNYAQCLYYLDLHFVGYNEDGSIASSSALTTPNPSRWVWQLLINGVDAEITAGGGTYKLDVISATEAPYNEDEVFNVPDMVSVSGSTLKQVTDTLATALNKSWVDRHGNSTVTYEFVWHKISEAYPNFKYPPNIDDPNTYSTIFSNQNQNTIDHIEIDNINGLPTFKFQTGANIASFIEGLISVNETCNKLIKNDPAIGQTGGADSNHPRFLVFRIESDVQFLNNYEPYTQQYFRKMIFHIWPYYTQKLITSKDQVQDSISPNYSLGIINDIVNNGLIHKRYDYIYTGLNVDVIDFKINYNFAWAALLPRSYGADNNIKQFLPPPIIANIDAVNAGTSQKQADEDKKAKILNLQEKYNNSLTDLNNLQTALNTLQSSGNATPQQIQQAQQNLTVQQNNVSKTASTLSSALGKGVPLTQVAKFNGSFVYAEDLLNNQTPTAYEINNQGTLLPIPIRQCFRAAEDATGQGNSGAISRDRSVVGALLNQLYETGTTNQQDLELTIRGDPYWLGETNLVRMQKLRKLSPLDATQGAAPIPTYQIGQSHILVHYRAPRRENNDFTPDFVEGLVFSGLYSVTQVTHTFGGTDGFKQTLKGNRISLWDLNKAASAASNMATGSSSSTTTHATDAITPPVNSGGTITNLNGSKPIDWYNSPEAAPYKSTIDGASNQYNVPAPLLAWQLGQESSFDPTAVGKTSTSSGVPMGIAQITTGTAKNVPGYGPVDPLDPNASIYAAAAYDQHLYNQTGTWQDALTKYGTLSGNPSQSVWNGYYNALNQSGLQPGQ